MLPLILLFLSIDPPKPALTDAQKLSIARMENMFLQKRAEAAEAELAGLKKRDLARDEMNAIAAEFAKQVEAIAGRPGCTVTAAQELDCPPAPAPEEKKK